MMEAAPEIASRAVVVTLCMLLLVALDGNQGGVVDEEVLQPPQLGGYDANASFAPDTRILITGAAGFIGFHTASRLARHGVPVVGVDNFNPYYDTNLKVNRAYQLHTQGVDVRFLDICDEAAMTDLFRETTFSHVIHLAAQAGVRNSVREPLNYVKTNVNCFVTLLQVLRRYPATRLVFASSSSVYGPAAASPFSVSLPLSLPGNVYAASKQVDELLAFAFRQQYGLSYVGLRFFTVYGPWGRPDMAAWMFTESVANGQQVPLYDNADLQRDFTFVDDIVDGILAVVNSTIEGRVFNLGRGRPEYVTEVISTVEKELGKHADVKRLPTPKTELLVTYADTTASAQAFGYDPKVGLREGLARFVGWYKEYQSQQQQQQHQQGAEASSLGAAQQEFIHQLREAYNDHQLQLQQQRRQTQVSWPPPLTTKRQQQPQQSTESLRD